MRLSKPSLYAWASVALFAFAAAAPAAETRTTSVAHVSGPIRLDGILNESAWRDAREIGEFTQAMPKPGQPPTERTHVWLARDDNYLYVAVRCEEHQIDKLVAKSMQRDTQVTMEDNIELFFDTYYDHRNAYYFATTPVGVLTDGRVVENRRPSLEWDGIWDVRAHVGDGEWTAEFQIPFKTLGFNAASDEWGFNASRHIGRLRERTRWETPTLDVQTSNMAKAGVLTGMKGLSQGVGLDIKPYGIGGMDWIASRATPWTTAHEPGADVFYRITSNLVSATTFNTDFAETESDARRVNLTRFDLFVPEKRSFFVEDAGIFSFAPEPSSGGGGGGGGGGEGESGGDVMPFFSRTIGIVDDAEAPIQVGEKLTGTMGRFDVGVLAVRTGEAENEDGPVAPATNLAVGRVKANFLSESYIGALVTQGDPTGQSRRITAGLDLKLATSNFLNMKKNFAVVLYGTGTRATGVQGRDNAFGGSVFYPNDLINASYKWMKIPENYEPALGYVPRTGVRLSSGTFEFAPRPGVYGIRQLTFGLKAENYQNLERRTTETSEITPSIEFQTDAGDRLSYQWQRSLEHLFEEWEVFDGVIVPEGKYVYGTHRLDVTTSRSRTISVSASLSKGTFYGGSRKSVANSLSWRPNRHLTTRLQLTQNWIKVPAGSFRTRLVSYRLEYAFTPLISLTNLIQYDTKSSNIGLQSRLRWILTPGREIHFVVNQGWERDELSRFESTQSRVRLKFNYTVRF